MFGSATMKYSPMLAFSLVIQVEDTRLNLDGVCKNTFIYRIFWQL